MGDVVTGKYQIGLSSFAWFEDRDRVVDLNVVWIWDHFSSYLIPKDPKIDPGLFIRPFTGVSWMLIFFTFSVHYFLLSLIKHCAGINNKGFQAVVEWTGWSLFVVLHAYYGGAMVMFFSVDSGLPFDSINDVMLAAPKWKIYILSGSEVMLQNAGNENYDKWLKEIGNENLKNYMVSSVGEGMKSLAKEDAVYFGQSQQVRRLFNKHEHGIKTLANLSDRRRMYFSILLTKNSPLMPYFKKVAFDSIESGLMEAVLHKWIGPKIRHSHNPEGSPLTVGQTFLVFTFLLTFIFLSLVTYFIEVITFKILMPSKQISCMRMDEKLVVVSKKSHDLDNIITVQDLETPKQISGANEELIAK